MTDTWTQLGDLPGPERRTASFFPFDDLPIAGGGWDGTTYFTDYYIYNPVLENWTAIPEFSGLAAHTPVSFNVNERGYVGTGGVPGGQTDQFWEFDKEGLTGVTDPVATQQSTIEIIVQYRMIAVVDHTSSKADNYQLCDASGRTIVQGQLHNDQIPVNDLPPGQYTLTLSSDQGVRRSQAFVFLAQ